MAKYSPHYNPHKVTALVRSINDWIFWVIFVLAVAPSFFPETCKGENIKSGLSIANIVCLSVFFVLDVVVEYFLFPASEQKRRDDFIDNSFGSNLAPVNSDEYYNNENVRHGLYKASCNLFENSFFTFSLVSKMTLRRIILPCIVLLAVIILACIGFNQVPLGLTILQLLFSVNVLGNLIKHLILYNKGNSIYEDWITLFNNSDFKSNTNNYQPSIYQNWLSYEAILSRIQPSIPQKLFDRHNPKLTQEWAKLKVKYKIQ